MYGWCHIVFTTALLAQTVHTASILPKNERCVTATYTALNYLSFAGETTTGFWQTRCQNRLKVTSIYAAAEVYCDEDERIAGFAQLDELCRSSANIELLPRQTVAENLTKEKIKQMEIVDFLGTPRDEVLDSPVLISSAYYDRVFRTIDSWETEMWSHYTYSYLGYFYWGCILLFGISHRLIQHIFGSRKHPKKHERLLNYAYRGFDCLYQWVYTHLLIAFPFMTSNRQVLWFDLLTRIDAILIAGFWVLSAVLTCMTYRLYDDNIYWPQPCRQLLRYLADRTGILSFANLPLLWLFAGRNNIFLWATGWSFARFNIFHRHVAWIATIQAVIHTVTYFALFVLDYPDHFIRKMLKPYLLCGTAATLAMALIIPLAVDSVRKRSYEFFLILHIAFSIVAVVGCFYHVIIFEGERYEYYLWPIVAIWVSDRLLRLVRIAYCNLHIRLRQGKIHSTHSFATFDEASNVVRLEVTLGSMSHQPTTSSYYYLYQPFRFCGWESHPFTLGAWNYEDDQRSHVDATLPVSDEEIHSSKLPLLSVSASPHRRDTYPTEDKPSSLRPKLIFWIRPYNGWTRHLRDQCLASATNNISPTILLEGPYGQSFPLWKYDSILLIAGGTGIACAVPYIQDHLRRGADKDDDYKDSERLILNKISLVWAAREAAFVHDVGSQELRDALSRDEFEASFYVTAAQSTSIAQATTTARVHPTPSSSTSSSSSSNDYNAAHDMIFSPLNIHHGRPDLQNIVLQHAQEAHDSDSSVAIVVSGPNAMADEVRTAVYLAMRKGYRGITFHEESFSW